MVKKGYRGMLSDLFVNSGRCSGLFLIDRERAIFVDTRVCTCSWFYCSAFLEVSGFWRDLTGNKSLCERRQRLGLWENSFID